MVIIMKAIETATNFLNTNVKNWQHKAKAAYDQARHTWSIEEAVLRIKKVQEYGLIPETPSDISDMISWCVVSVMYSQIRNEVPEDAITDLIHGIYNPDELYCMVENAGMAKLTATHILNLMYAVVYVYNKEPIDLTEEQANSIERYCA